MSPHFLLTHFHEQLPLLCHGPPPLPTLLDHSGDKNGKKNKLFVLELLFQEQLAVNRIVSLRGNSLSLFGNSRTDRQTDTSPHDPTAHTDTSGL